jgi:hypothetical protein
MSNSTNGCDDCAFRATTSDTCLITDAVVHVNGECTTGCFLDESLFYGTTPAQREAVVVSVKTCYNN